MTNAPIVIGGDECSQYTDRQAWRSAWRSRHRRV